MDAVYKIRHKPTGLFFRPSKTGCTHLTTRGKIYDKKPTRCLLPPVYKHPIPIQKRDNEMVYYEWRKTIPDEWEIVEYKIVEVL